MSELAKKIAEAIINGGVTDAHAEGSESWIEHVVDWDEEKMEAIIDRHLPRGLERNKINATVVTWPPLLHEVLAHLQELRDAWERGAVHERDGGGGTRSNRNVDLEVRLRDLLAPPAERSE